MLHTHIWVCCLCLFAAQEMEERIQHFDTFLWDGEHVPVSKILNCLGPQRQKLSKRVGSFGVQPSTQKYEHTQEIQRPLLAGGDTARKRLRRETFNGAIVSGTWPDPDWIYTTKPLEVCQSHMHTHQWWRAILVLLGCYANFYPRCSLDYFLTWTISETNRSGDVISQPGCFSQEQAVHTHTHTHT